MKLPELLVVEDESAIRELLVLALRPEGFVVHEAADVQTALVFLFDKRPDLILLDWMLPDQSGLDFARRLRRDTATRDIPIILLTARAEEGDKIRGLESGADDYITKPFSVRELLARIRAVLRRTTPGLGSALNMEGLILDPSTHRVLRNDQTIPLGPTEFRLLEFFMTHPERAYSRAQLIDQVWGGQVYIDERTVDVHIRRLRKALTPSGCERLVQTVRGIGYRFSAKQ